MDDAIGPWWDGAGITSDSPPEDEAEEAEEEIVGEDSDSDSDSQPSPELLEVEQKDPELTIDDSGKAPLALQGSTRSSAAKRLVSLRQKARRALSMGHGTSPTLWEKMEKETHDSTVHTELDRFSGVLKFYCQLKQLSDAPKALLKAASKAVKQLGKAIKTISPNLRDVAGNRRRVVFWLAITWCVQAGWVSCRTGLT